MQYLEVFKVETFGAVDGPGLRLVIFSQGCNFRCKYCHNPESWSLTNKDAKLMSANDIIKIYENNEPYYSNGGITISGGEPMLHSKFLLELGNLCKKKNIHLAIDTSASTFISNKDDYLSLLDLVDLWIVDIKATNQNDHLYITGCKQTTGMNFIKFLEEHNKSYWIRQVILQGFNDSKEKLNELISLIKNLKYMKKWELLSYHTLGVHKYEELKINYELKDAKVLTKEQFNVINEYVEKALN